MWILKTPNMPDTIRAFLNLFHYMSIARLKAISDVQCTSNPISGFQGYLRMWGLFCGTYGCQELQALEICFWVGFLAADLQLGIFQ